MELQQYWHIIWKRVWVVILLLAVVLAVSLFTHTTPPTVYSTSLRFTVGVETQPAPVGRLNEETFHAWVASEYLADDLSALVSSQQFATDVNRHLAEAGSAVQVFPGNIAGLRAEKEHRILRLTLTWGNPDELTEIGQAIVKALQEDSPAYFPQFGTATALIHIIDEPAAPFPIPQSLSQRLDLPLRLLIALVAGLALTFLLDYLDTSIRSSPELEALDIAVLAEVPKHKRR